MNTAEQPVANTRNTTCRAGFGSRSQTKRTWSGGSGNTKAAKKTTSHYHLSKEDKHMASRARLEGICDYRLWTTEELIDAYAWEAKRINQKDREIAQRGIKRELKRRFDATLRLLDDEQTTDNPKGTYRYLLNE